MLYFKRYKVSLNEAPSPCRWQHWSWILPAPFSKARKKLSSLKTRQLSCGISAAIKRCVYISWSLIGFLQNANTQVDSIATSAATYTGWWSLTRALETVQTNLPWETLPIFLSAPSFGPFEAEWAVLAVLSPDLTNRRPSTFLFRSVSKLGVVSSEFPWI